MRAANTPSLTVLHAQSLHESNVTSSKSSSNVRDANCIALIHAQDGWNAPSSHAIRNAAATHLANPISRRCRGGMPFVAVPPGASWSTSNMACTAKELRSTRAHRSGVRCGAIPGSCWNASLHSASTCTAAEFCRMPMYRLKLTVNDMSSANRLCRVDSG